MIDASAMPAVLCKTQAGLTRCLNEPLKGTVSIHLTLIGISIKTLKPQIYRCVATKSNCAFTNQRVYIYYGIFSKKVILCGSNSL